MRRWPLWTALALAALFAFQRISDVDAGWLLSLGREVARGLVPSTNALAWTAPDAPWYPTNWLFDLLVYGAFRAGGILGVQLLTFALAAGALSLVNRAAQRSGASAAAADAATLLAVGVFWTRITPRPHLVEYLLEALVLDRCVAARLAHRFRPLLALPGAFVAWANAHQSAPFGLAVAALALLGAPFQWEKRERNGALAILVLCAAALFATPGFDANLRDLFAHLRIGEVLPILEHQRPTLKADLPLFLLGGVVLAAALATRQLPALLFVAMTFGLGRRFGGDMAVAGVIPVALAAHRLRETAAMGLGALGGCVALLLVAHVPVTQLGGLLGAQWEPAVLPVEAVEFARARGLAGRGFQSLRFGGYVSFVLGPDFQDTRLRAWPLQFWRDERAAMQSPAAFSRWLDGYGAIWALVASQAEPLSGHGLLERNPAWSCIHRDAVAEVWIRK